MKYDDIKLYGFVAVICIVSTEYDLHGGVDFPLRPRLLYASLYISISCIYDMAENRTNLTQSTAASRQYAWDAYDRLRMASVADSSTARYTYDALGRRRRHVGQFGHDRHDRQLLARPRAAGHRGVERDGGLGGGEDRRSEFRLLRIVFE
jgi:hypothetical protein